MLPLVFLEAKRPAMSQVSFSLWTADTPAYSFC